MAELGGTENGRGERAGPGPADDARDSGPGSDALRQGNAADSGAAGRGGLDGGDRPPLLEQIRQSLDVGPWAPAPERMRQALPAIGVLCCMFLCAGLGALLPPADGSWKRVDPKPSAGAPPQGDLSPASQETPLPVLSVVLVFGLLLAVAGLAWRWLADHEFQGRRGLFAVAQRADPAVWFLDLAAALSLLLGLFPIFAWTAIQHSPRSWWLWDPAKKWWLSASPESLTLSTVIQFLIYALIMIVVLRLVRARAGALGLAGLWPFWKNPSCEEQQNPGRDLKQAAAFYFLFAGLLMFSGLLNAWILERLGRVPDENPMAGPLQRENRPEIIWTLGFLAIVGAAVAEEFIFRGLLYTLLKRHLGRWAGALLAAIPPIRT